MLTPSAVRTLPKGLLQITWSGLLNGEKARAVVLGGDRVLDEFEGHTPTVGFHPAKGGNAWFCDLSKLPSTADMVQLRVRPLSVCTIQVTVSAANSIEQSYEHVGVEVEGGTDAYIFTFERDGTDWHLRALSGRAPSEPGVGGVAQPGKGVLVVIDSSASMLRWFDSGAVSRVVRALQEDAATAGVATLRIAFTGKKLAQIGAVSVSQDVDELIHEHLAEVGLRTQADAVGTAINILATAGTADTVVVLVTDALPSGSTQELVAAAHSAVVAMIGVSDPRGIAEPNQLAELRQQGLGVGLLGEVRQSPALTIDALRSAIPAPQDGPPTI